MCGVRVFVCVCACVWCACMRVFICVCRYICNSVRMYKYGKQNYYTFVSNMYRLKEKLTTTLTWQTLARILVKLHQQKE